MHVEQQLRIQRVVRESRHLVDAVDPGVDVVDPLGGGVRLGLRAERDRVGEDQRALEPLPGVALVEAGLPRAGDHQRVRGLHQHGPRAPNSTVTSRWTRHQTLPGPK